MSTSQIISIALLGAGSYYAYKYVSNQLDKQSNNQPNFSQPGSTAAAVINDDISNGGNLPRNTTIIPVDPSAVAAWSPEETQWIDDYTRSHFPNLKDPGNKFQTVQINPLLADAYFKKYKQIQAQTQNRAISHAIISGALKPSDLGLTGAAATQFLDNARDYANAHNIKG